MFIKFDDVYVDATLVESVRPVVGLPSSTVIAMRSGAQHMVDVPPDRVMETLCCLIPRLAHIHLKQSEATDG